MRPAVLAALSALVISATASAAPPQVVPNGSLDIGGNHIAAPYLFDQNGDSVFVNNLRLWPRVTPLVGHATVTNTIERRHTLFAQVKDHPAWTISQKLNVFTSASDLVEKAWANPSGTTIWVKFVGEDDAQPFDLTPSQADPVDVALNQRLDAIIECLQSGGAVYFGADYTVYVDRQQLASTKAQLATRLSMAPVNDAFGRKYEHVLRDRRSPVPLSLYRR